jgi:hypothetical protein
MAEHASPRLNKLPFLAGDVLLIVVGAWLALRPGPPLDLWHNLLLAGCVLAGAWLAVVPFLVEHRTQARLAEAGGLSSTVEQIKGLQAVGEKVSAATARWHSAQEAAEQTARAAREMANQITTEARSFSESMQKAHDVEVRNLRLEVEKLRRAEGDWVQVLVRMLDHVYALHSAGLRSGQPELSAQLGQFQNACRDAVRRVGLVALEAAPDSPFEDRMHELPPGAEAQKTGLVAQTLATGFTYQGQLIRRVLVTLKPHPEEPLIDAAAGLNPNGAEPAAPLSAPEAGSGGSDPGA